MQVYVANICTESCDRYNLVFSYEPTREQIIEWLMKYEGADPEDDREFYNDTTSVKVELQEVID